MKIVKVPEGNVYGSGNGNFGYKDMDELMWENCRESFHDEAESSYFFSTSKQKKVFAFIKQAEDILKLPKNQRATLSLTNKKSIIHIHLGRFWDKDEATRQLFTILLRIGNTTTSKSFWAAAKGSRYLSGAAFYAFQRFMNGNNHWKHSEFCGWVREFGELDLCTGDNAWGEGGQELTTKEHEQLMKALIDMRLTKAKPTKKRKHHANRK